MRTYYLDTLSPKGYEVLCSPSMKGALQLFEEERERIIGVISDGNVVEGDFGPIFVEQLRRLGFEGPIIGASMSSELGEKLLRAGCSHRVHDKSDAPQALHQAICATSSVPT